MNNDIVSVNIMSEGIIMSVRITIIKNIISVSKKHNISEDHYVGENIMSVRILHNDEDLILCQWGSLGHYVAGDLTLCRSLCRW